MGFLDIFRRAPRVTETPDGWTWQVKPEEAAAIAKAAWDYLADETNDFIDNREIGPDVARGSSAMGLVFLGGLFFDLTVRPTGPMLVEIVPTSGECYDDYRFALLEGGTAIIVRGPGYRGTGEVAPVPDMMAVLGRVSGKE